MAKLQAKTKLARNHVMALFEHFVSVDEDGVSLLCYVTFDQMAEIVDYLRNSMRYPIWPHFEDLMAKYEDLYEDLNECGRLLDENRKLNNDNFRLLEENKQLKDKTKNLPRIATLNKRIHELKEQIKKCEHNRQDIQ